MPPPLPVVDLLRVAGVSLKSRVAHGAVWCNVFLSTAKAWHVGDSQPGNDVILVGNIAHRPDKPRSRRFRARLRAKLHFPLRPILVADHKLGLSSTEIFFDKGELAARLP